MKKIAMILNSDLTHGPYSGGVDPRVFKEAKTLVDNGYEVTVFCSTANAEGKMDDEYHGVFIKRIFNKPIKMPGKGRIGRYIRTLKTVREISKYQPDIIHSHDLDTLHLGVYAKWFTHASLIYDSHEDWPLYVKSELPRFYQGKPHATIKLKWKYAWTVMSSPLTRRYGSCSSFRN